MSVGSARSQIRSCLEIPVFRRRPAYGFRHGEASFCTERLNG